MRKKRAITNWAFPNAPHEEWSESLKTVPNKLGENENVNV